MKRRLVQSVAIVAGLLLLLHSPRLAAQQPSSVPSGEFTIDDFALSGDAFGDVTNGGIYIGHYGVPAPKESVWTPPDHCSISLIRFKAGSTLRKTTIFVLTDCYEVYQVTIETQTVAGITLTSATTTPIESPLTDGIGDIAGDDLYCTSGSLMFVTHDNKTWLVDTSGLNGSSVNGIVLDTSLNVYVGTSNGMFEQAPAATTWQPLSGSPKNISSFFVSKEDDIFASGYFTGGLYHSMDHGATWPLDTLGMGQQTMWNMSEDAKGNLYCVTRNFQTSDHIWMQQSPSTPWQRIDGNFPVLGNGSNAQVLTDIFVDTVMHVTTSFGSYLSSDNGASWHSDDAGIPAADIYGFYEYSNSRRIIATSLGIFTKDKTDTAWSKTFPASGFQAGLSFFVDNNGTLYAIVGYTNTYPPVFYVSTDHGSTWTTDTVGISQYHTGSEFVDENGNEHLAPFQYGTSMQLFVKPHEGSWQGDSTGYTPKSGDQPGIFVSDHHGSIYLTINNSTNGNRLLRRPTSGGTWTEVSTTALGRVPTNFTATKDGKLVAGGNNMASEYYDGTGWTRITDPPDAENFYLSGHPASVDSMNRLWSIYGSVDPNSNFTPVAVYWTSDLGQHWTKATDSSYNFSTLVSSADSTFGLTMGDGLLVMASAPASVAISNIGSDRISIVPNPSSGPVEIKVFNARISNAEIFDLLGNPVERMNGTHNLEWNGHDQNGGVIANGIYFIRISGIDQQGNPFLASKQVVIER